MTDWSVRIDTCVVDGSTLIEHRACDDSGGYTYYTCTAGLEDIEHNYRAHYNDQGPFPVDRGDYEPLQLRAEVTRLRAALTEIADECTMFVWGDVARKALGDR